MGDASFVRSMMGPQVNSAHGSSPMFGFGSATREQAGKVFVSTEHARLANKGISPGPAYTMRACIGPQVDGAIESSPQWVFGSGARFVEEFKKENNVGPGSYDLKSSLAPQFNSAQENSPVYSMGTSTREKVQSVYVSQAHSNSALAGITTRAVPFYSLPPGVGKQTSSQKGSQPSWVFSSSKRFEDPALKLAAKMPAPGCYGAESGLGPQFSSARRSAPLAGFGTSTRNHAEKVFTSAEQEKTKSYGKGSPGPCTYLPPMAKRAAPSYGFGSCDRFYTRKMALRLGDTPSAAHYNV